MFESPDYPKSLSEEVFNQWLENGRQRRMGYHYLLVIWDKSEGDYQPVYIQKRDEISQYKKEMVREKLIAAYDLYSESRIF